MFRLLDRLHPWAYMRIVVDTFSAFPVLFELGDAEKSPFLFDGIQQSDGRVCLCAGDVLSAWFMLGVLREVDASVRCGVHGSTVISNTTQVVPQ